MVRTSRREAGSVPSPRKVTSTSRTSSGGVCVNHTLMHITPPELPFGGVGDSGQGRYHGQSGFDTFSNLKSVLRKPTRPDPALLYPPYTDTKEKIVRRAL